MKNNMISTNEVKFINEQIIIKLPNSIKKLVLKSKKASLIADYEENKFDLIKFIDKNNVFLVNNKLFEVLCINEENEINDIYINYPVSSEKQYICNNYPIKYKEGRYNVNIYISNKNKLKIKIEKLNDEKLMKCILDYMSINDKKLNLSFKIIKNVENEFEIMNEVIYKPKDIVLYVYGADNDNINCYKSYNIYDNNVIFEIDLNSLKIKGDIDQKLQLIILADEELIPVKVNESICSQKITLKNDEYIRSAYIKSEKNKRLNIYVESNIKLKPRITKVIYDNELFIEGDLNYNINAFINKKNYSKLCLISRDKKKIREFKVNIKGNLFNCSISNDELLDLKNKFPGEWDIRLVTVIGDEEIESIVDINNEKSNLIKTTLRTKNDSIDVQLYLTKNNKRPALKLKSQITITKILNMYIKNNEIQMKFRTKENIEKLLNENSINVSILDTEGRFDSKRIKKIGKKTFVGYFNVEDIERYIERWSKKGIRICVKSNHINSLTQLEEIDTDAIYRTFLEKVQKTKKYKNICSKLYNKIFIKLPMRKNRIMFESFLGRNISGNPKYLYKQMVKDGLDKKYELIWILNDLSEDIEGNHKKVKRKTLKYYYYMATSKYWIFNCRQADEIKKRKENIYLQTWHGTPLKKLAMDMDNVRMAGQTDIEDYKNKFYSNSRRWDYLISQNDYSTNIFKRAFAFNKKMLDFGYPANDILYSKNNIDDINGIKSKLGIPNNKKVILYAPTWRDDNFYKKGHYRMSIQLDLDKMQRELGDEYVVLLRMHYLITNNINIENYKGFVLDYSQGYDIQELYLASDILITDYSSVMFDYSNLKRPIIFFTYDIEQYRDSLRGFYFDFENEAPGPLVQTTDEVINSIKTIDKINYLYSDKQKKFYDKFCHIDDGNSAKRILNEIL